MDYVGISLIIIFILLALISFFTSRRKVIAKNGGVAIGGSNHGEIRITNSTQDPKNTSFWNIWNILIGLIGVIGVIFTIWPLNK
ncbi:MAG: hypothetical protein WCG35_11050 [Betaproteobacteria bacterium]